MFKTKGLVLRSVKYGETSLIVTIFTEIFGLQAYLVNGARSSTARKPSQAAMYQPGALLDLVVYHQEGKNLQRIREARWAVLYQRIFFDVVTHSVALFLIELLQKCLKEPESHPELFYFVEDALVHLDKATGQVQGNFPLYFALHLASFFGLRIDDNYSMQKTYLDLEEGYFAGAAPVHQHYLAEPYSGLVSGLLKVMQPAELTEIGLNRESRRVLLQACETFFSLHLSGFTPMKTLPVLRALLED